MNQLKLIEVEKKEEASESAVGEICLDEDANLDNSAVSQLSHEHEDDIAECN